MPAMCAAYTTRRAGRAKHLFLSALSALGISYHIMLCDYEYKIKRFFMFLTYSRHNRPLRSAY